MIAPSRKFSAGSDLRRFDLPTWTYRFAVGHGRHDFLSTAWIDGEAVSVEHAVQAAAELLSGARLPVITGLQTDMAGIKAAVRLAIDAGGVIDHAQSADIYPLIEALRDAGMMLGAPSEVRRRADRVLIVGADAFAASPDLPAYLFSSGPDLGQATRGSTRQAIWLGAPKDGVGLPSSVSIEAVPCDDADLVDALAMLRAAVSGHRFGKGPLPATSVGALADLLKGTGFGCAIFAPRTLGAIGVEMLAGLVADLNAKTRFTSLPVFVAGQAYAAAQAVTWMVGTPLRTSFARGVAEHDPELFEAGRLVTSGEADCAVVVSGLAGVAVAEPDWSGAVPTIAITAQSSAWTNPPKIGFRIAEAGADHDTILFDERFGSFVPVDGKAGSSEHRTAADTLDAIVDALASKKEIAA